MNVGSTAARRGSGDDAEGSRFRSSLRERAYNMLRSLAFGKKAAALAILALPLTTAGCQSTGAGWGWSPSTPSFSSLNPWKPKDSQLASQKEKPSHQVPTPPAAMLAGSGMARNSQAGAPTYNSSNFTGSRPSGGYTASTNDYGTRQVSATQGEGGYQTGPYSMGATGGTQQGPYSPGMNNPYAGVATADRRSDASYSTPQPSSQNYGVSQPSSQTYGAAPSNPQTYGSYPAAGSTYGSAASASPYTGATGVSSGGATAARQTQPGATGATATSSGGDSYRPGSTGRSPDVQRTSYDNQGAAGAAAGTDYGSGYPTTGAASYPTTGASDESAYR